MLHILIPVVLVLIAVILVLVAKRQSAKTGLYGLYVDASRPGELSDGVPSYYGGTVQSVAGQPQLVAPYSKQPCVWYEYSLEQEQVRRDSEGGMVTEWRQISSVPPQAVMFQLQNQNGSIWVQPNGADVVKPQIFQDFVQPDFTPTSSQVGNVVENVLGTVSALSGNRTRVTERYIPIGQYLFAGGVSSSQNGSRTFLSDQSYPLVLTPESKADLVKDGARSSAIEYTFAAILGVSAVLVFVLLKK